MTLRASDHAGVTDTGRRRSSNEDAYLAEPPLFVVADGMGGGPAGDLAARAAVATMRGASAGDLGERVAAAHRAVLSEAKADPRRAGMATTMTAAALADGGVLIGHVGDSRAYRVRDGKITQLTDDHALVAELVRSGALDPEKAERHPQRSAISRALGIAEGFSVDLLEVNARDGDVFLLCSDGLSGMVDDADIAPVLAAGGSLERAGEELIAAANARGGADNITAVVFRVADDS